MRAEKVGVALLLRVADGMSVESSLDDGAHEIISKMERIGINHLLHLTDIAVLSSPSFWSVDLPEATDLLGP